MNNGSSHETTNWYAPLHTETAAPSAAPEAADKKKHARRGWTPGKVLGVIALVALIIVGSSLLFSSIAPETALPELLLPQEEPAQLPEDEAGDAELPEEFIPIPELPTEEAPGEMPDSFFDFFREVVSIFIIGPSKFIESHYFVAIWFLTFLQHGIDFVFKSSFIILI